MGLLFAAAQIGVWKLPLNLKQNLLQKNREASFVLVDSNGVVLLPPNNELSVAEPFNLPKGERPNDNLGFDYYALHRLSRRDQLISRVWKNIVPLAQDDDVQIFSDLKMYSVVSEVQPTRWKLALSIPMPTKE